MTDAAVVVPWISEAQFEYFLRAWGIDGRQPGYLLSMHDVHREGTGVMKNRGIAAALDMGAELVVVLDDDCYPRIEGDTLPQFIARHAEALKPQPVSMYQAVTEPPSRGTPYRARSVSRPVAASMGFWYEVGDYDAVRQLAYGDRQMVFRPGAIHGKYFALSGMNLAFRPRQWLPWCRFIEGVPRYDDIWMGWLWQREAYRRGYCFNLNGPCVTHARQSNVWSNLAQEVTYARQSETAWRDIMLATSGEYGALRRLLPDATG
jgi:hypothetical protein